MDYDQPMIKNSMLHDHPSRRALLLGVASLFFMPLGAHAADPSVLHVTSPRILGKADAPIKVIELFSMTCSHCASFHRLRCGRMRWPVLCRKTNISQWYRCC
jgi:hypothetical protein